MSRPAAHTINPTEDYAVREEIREKRGCGVCIRSRPLMPDVYVCQVGKTYPACRRDRCGFVYDTGDIL